MTDAPRAGLLTPEELAAMEERVAKASPGPWEVTDACTVEGEDGAPLLGVGSFIIESDDADFIAHARADLPRLIETVKALQHTARHLQREVEGLLGNWERSIREIAGHTNVACIRHAIDELNAALSPEAQEDNGRADVLATRREG